MACWGAAGIGWHLSSVAWDVSTTTLFSDGFERAGDDDWSFSTGVED